MTVRRYRFDERRRDDAEQAHRRMYSPRTVGEAQVWHRCAVLLGWRWETGEWVRSGRRARTAEEACNASRVGSLRDACLLLRDASS